jgi:hypothetical protein
MRYFYAVWSRTAIITIAGVLVIAAVMFKWLA